MTSIDSGLSATANNIFAELGLDQEQLATLTALNENNSASDEARYQKNMAAGTAVHSSSRGLTLVAKLAYIDGAYPDAATGVNRATKIKARVTQLPDHAPETYGVICKAGEVHALFPELSKLNAIVTARGFIYDESPSDPEETVLVARARPGVNPETGEKYGKDVRISERPVTLAIVIKEGDDINGAVWVPYVPTATTNPKIGNFVVIRGAGAREHESRGMWNFGEVQTTKFNELDADRGILARAVEHTPRNKIVLLPLTQEPMSKEEREKSFEERTYELDAKHDWLLNQHLLFSTDAEQVEMTADKADEIKKQLGKKYNVFVGKSIYPSKPDDYFVKLEREGKPTEHFSDLNIMQALNVKSPQGMAKFMLRHKFRSWHCAQILGIADPFVFRTLAPNWLPELRVIFTGSIDHQDTFDSDINKEASKPAEFSDIDYLFSIRVPATASVMSNILFTLLNRSVEVTYDFINEFLSEGSGEVSSPYSSKSYYNNLPQTPLVCLTDYTGSLRKFQEGYRFFVARTEPLDDEDATKIMELPDEQRAKECAKSLSGDKTAAVKIGVLKKNALGASVAIFAMANEICDDIQERPEFYALKDLSDQMHEKHVETDTSEWYNSVYEKLTGEAAALPASSNKRKAEMGGFGSGGGGDEVAGGSGEPAAKKKKKVEAAAPVPEAAAADEQDGDEDEEKNL